MTDINPIMGYKTYAEYVVETVWGTCPTNPAFLWFGANEMVRVKIGKKVLEDYHLKGSAATVHRIIDALLDGAQELGFEIEFTPQVGVWSAIYTLCTGNASTIADALSSFTMNVKKSTYSFVLHGCMVESWKIKIAKNEKVRFTLTGRARDISFSAPTMGSGSHATASSARPLTWLDAYLKISGTAQDNVREIDFELNNTLEGEPRIRSADPSLIAFLVSKKAELKGSVQLDFIDQTWLTDMLAGTSHDMAIVMDSKTITWVGGKFQDSVDMESKPEDLIGEHLAFTAISPTLA